jgi:uncharacterized membrane-anchored protein YjiN (DUF445 family)
MKRSATALLAAVTLVYIGAVAFRGSYPWLSYVAAASEAGIVGALADWFAVVALFHHPLNIRAIPHTNIISNNKERIAKQLSEFIQREFLAPEVVVVRIRDFNPGRRLARWLCDAENVDRIAGYVRRTLGYWLNALDDARVRHFVQATVGRNLQELDVGRLLGALLQALTHHKRHHVLLEAALQAADDVLRRAETRAFIADKLVQHFWILKLSQRFNRSITESTAEKIVEFTSDVLAEIRVDSEHEIRRRFDAAIAGLIARLDSDPETRSRVERLKNDLLQSGAVRAYIETLWTDLHAWLRADLEREDSVIHGHVAAAVRFLGNKLHEDHDLQAWMDEQILTEAPSFVRRYRADIGRFIEDHVNSWTSQKLVNEFERAIGPDLQYIRINGTVVGAFAGLAIYSLTHIVSS